MINYKLTGDRELMQKMKHMSLIDFSKVAHDNLAEIYNKTKRETPIDSGELRISSGINFTAKGGSVGYTKEYAPHVEFGHVSRDGGYVEGQYFLRDMLEKQRPIFIKELKEKMKT